MARITLLRHGKAELPSMAVSDFDRGLATRGQQNATAVGKFIADHKMLPQLVLVSSAARTRQTYALARQAWPDDLPSLFEPRLYEASASMLLDCIIAHAGDLSHVLVIGHNPSLVVLLNHMTGEDVTEVNMVEFPTCCMADIGFEGDRISQITPDAGRLLSFKRARDL